MNHIFKECYSKYDFSPSIKKKINTSNNIFTHGDHNSKNTKKKIAHLGQQDLLKATINSLMNKFNNS